MHVMVVSHNKDDDDEVEGENIMMTLGRKMIRFYYIDGVVIPENGILEQAGPPPRSQGLY